MYWNAVLLMAWSLATVSAILDSTRSQRYWEDTKSEDVGRYSNENMLKTYMARGGGNKHFVTSVFPGISLNNIFNSKLIIILSHIQINAIDHLDTK